MEFKDINFCSIYWKCCFMICQYFSDDWNIHLGPDWPWPSFINLCCDLCITFTGNRQISMRRMLPCSKHSLPFLKTHRPFTAICCWTVKEGRGRHWQKVDDGALPLFLWGSAWGSLACLNCSEAHCCRDELQPVSPDRECKRGITGGGQHGQQAGTRKEGKHTPHLDASHHLSAVVIRL